MLQPCSLLPLRCFEVRRRSPPTTNQSWLSSVGSRGFSQSYIHANHGIYPLCTACSTGGNEYTASYMWTLLDKTHCRHSTPPMALWRNNRIPPTQRSDAGADEHRWAGAAKEHKSQNIIKRDPSAKWEKYRGPALWHVLKSCCGWVGATCCRHPRSTCTVGRELLSLQQPCTYVTIWLMRLHTSLHYSTLVALTCR